MNKAYEEWKKARRNRIVTIVLGAVLLAALAVMFVIGLQGGSALEGNWYLTTVDGEPLADNRLYIQLSFRKDGQGTLTRRVRGEDADDTDVTAFTWHADGDSLNLGASLFFPGDFRLMQGEPLKWNITGGSLEIYTDGASQGTLIFLHE